MDTATGTSDSELRNTDGVLDDVLSIFALVLKVPPQTLAVDATLPEIGVDSLVLFDIFEPIKDRFGVGLSMRKVLTELGTIRRIAAFVASRQSAREPATLVPVASSPDPAAEAPPAPPVDAEHDGSSARRLIEAQLEVMSMQLALLAGQPLAGRAPQASAADVGGRPIRRGMSFINVADRPRLNDDSERTTYLASLVWRYNARTSRSKAHATRFRSLVADSRNAVGFDLRLKEMHYPLVSDRHEGAWVWDADGNRYVDMTMGFGVHLLGHNPRGLSDALAAQSTFGIGLRNSGTLDVAELVSELTGMGRMLFVNDGTEAVMAAVRAARTASGRDKLVIFKPCYHGHWDAVLAHPSGAAGRSGPLYLGVPPGSVEDTAVFDYGSREALDYVTRNSTEIAAVMIEPIPLRDPALADREFLVELRRVTAEAGVLLIFDEIVTGFRCHPAGIQGLFGIQADLAIYGKVAGGGMPIGIVAARGDVLDSVDGGPWSYGDDSYPSAQTTMLGGTFFQHPLSIAGGRFVLGKLRDAGPGLQRSLDERAKQLVEGLNEVFRFAGVPIQARGFSSFFRLQSLADLTPLYYNLIDRGVYIWEWRSWFLSDAHTDEHLDKVLDAMQESIEELQRHRMI